MTYATLLVNIEFGQLDFPDPGYISWDRRRHGIPRLEKVIYAALTGNLLIAVAKLWPPGSPAVRQCSARPSTPWSTPETRD